MGKINHRKLAKGGKEVLENQLRGALKNSGVPAKTVPLLLRLLSQSEMVMIARRLQIARSLLAGETFEDLRRNLGVGWSTIETVHRWLEVDLEGYQELLQSLPQHAEKSSGRRSWPRPYTFLWLRKKYPSRMLLFNLLFGDPFRK